jgi:biopolymer transport protein ExbB
MITISLTDIWKSSPTIMTVLFVCSVLLVATFLERWWCFSTRSRADESLWHGVERALLAKNFALATQEAKQNSLFAQSLLEVISLMQSSPAIGREELEDFWQLRRDEAAEVMRRQLAIFSTLSFITPLIGLMGSVLGIHHSFHAIALSGMGGPSVIAAGVSEALLCTLVGVSVAVPSLIANNIFFSLMVGRLSSWDRVGQELGRVMSSLSKGSVLPAA